MTAVYERCGENIWSSRRSSATVNFRPPLFRAGKAEKAAWGGAPGSRRTPIRRARLMTRLFHSFAGRPAAEMTPVLRVRRRCSDSAEFTTWRGIRMWNPAENGTCGWGMTAEEEKEKRINFISVRRLVNERIEKNKCNWKIVKLDKSEDRNEGMLILLQFCYPNVIWYITNN